MILVFTTFSDKKEAHNLGHKLLEKKLIACYNLIPAEAAYWWEQKIVDEKEFLMIIKTNKNFETVKKFITEYHGDDTPEIIGVETKKVGEKYLKWLKDITC